MISYPEIWFLRAFMIVILAVGGIISYYSLLAWKRLGLRSMFYLGVGFDLVSFGAALSGVVYEVLTHDLLTAWIVSAAIMMVGFVIILYSLLTEGPKPSEPLESP